jgi:hypothetical protein
MSVQLNVNDSEREPEGLKDGGHVYIVCSNCNAYLMDIWRTRPFENDVWKIRAKCPFCRDKSFAVDIKGGFHAGGYGTAKKDDEDDDVLSTRVETFDIIDDTFTFTLIKATPDAKPIYRHG